MIAQHEPGQSIPIASVPNLRDVGGWPTRDGSTVRTGLLYRSTDLNGLAGDDMTALGKLGIRSVYDLRSAAERTSQPDHLPPATEYIALDLLEDSADAAPAQLLRVEEDPAAAQAILGQGKALKLFERGYRELVSLSSARAGYRRLFTDLLDATHRPALFHCTTGKDRTGWASASILMLLGVPDDAVMKEYLLTNAQLLPSEKPLLEHFKSLGGNPALLRPLVAVEPAYLNASLDEMRKKFGSIEGYFAEGLKIDAAGQAALRSIFL